MTSDGMMMLSNDEKLPSEGSADGALVICPLLCSIGRPEDKKQEITPSITLRQFS